MSGICGILSLDGAPADREVLEAMTAFLTFRGPDAQRTWIEGPIGFGHTLLRTTFESKHEQQPATLDGEVWITADARIDGWVELKSKLTGAGRVLSQTITDADLILHAYHVWGEDCVEQLIGDFAFAIWDGRTRRLFCARDHFGVKPFFYAHLGQLLTFSNTLDCLRQHPRVSSELNDLAIADFLLFDSNQEPDTTTFADIRRLLPGHTLTVSHAGISEKMYWRPVAESTLRYRRNQEYVEHFHELLSRAVSDRLRGETFSFELSGGMDSGAVAATAVGLMRNDANTCQWHAFTTAYDHLIPDRERYYSSQTAQFLKIPHDIWPVDGYRLFERFSEVTALQPEPMHDPTAVRNLDQLLRVPANIRVILTGWEGDALLHESPRPYARLLWEKKQLVRLVLTSLGYAWSQRRLVPLSWRERWGRRKTGAEEETAAFPEWFSYEFEARLNLRDRYRRIRSHTRLTDSLRPNAERILGFMVSTGCFFEGYDLAYLPRPLEYRHPLLDLRIVNFCLSLPPFPWCVDKHILRESMKGRLPETVRKRPKSPLAGDPHWVLRTNGKPATQNLSLANPLLRRYIDSSAVPALSSHPNRGAYWMNLRPFSLNLWLDAHCQGPRPTCHDITSSTG